MSAPVVKKKKDKLAAFKIGFSLAFTLQPFEVLRTQLVLHNETDPVFRKKNGFSQTADTVRSIHRKYGVLGFWKGCSMAVVKSTMSAGLFYTFLEFFTEQYKPYRSGVVKMSDLEYTDPSTVLSSDSTSYYRNKFIDFMIACSSKLVAATCVNPVNVIKTRLEGHSGDSKISSYAIMKKTYQKGGITGFWRGLGATLARDVPYSGI